MHTKTCFSVRRSLMCFNPLCVHTGWILPDRWASTETKNLDGIFSILCVYLCVCVCVWERERYRHPEWENDQHLFLAFKYPVSHVIPPFFSLIPPSFSFPLPQSHHLSLSLSLYPPSLCFKVRRTRVTVTPEERRNKDDKREGKAGGKTNLYLA